MKMFIIGLIAAAAMIMMPSTVSYAEAEAGDSGNYEGVDWRITSDDELVLGQAGDIQEIAYKEYRDYHYIPWRLSDITSVRFEGTVYASGYLGYLFSGCKSLKTIDFTGFDTTEATNMSYMFEGDKALTSVDLSGLNTSSVGNMYGMFNGCSSLSEADLSGKFSTVSVWNMSHMFDGCAALENVDISGFSFMSAENFSYMFNECAALKTVKLYKSGSTAIVDVTKVSDMSYMFSGCSSLTGLDLSKWSTALIGDLSYMFSGCTSLASLDIKGQFTTNEVTNMEAMFKSCQSLKKLDLSGFETPNLMHMASMFEGCSSLEELDLSTFNTKYVIEMNKLFYSCGKLAEIDLTGFDTSDATTMSQMFYGCRAVTSLDLSNFKTSGVTTMYNMFYDCQSLKALDLLSFNITKVGNMEKMLYGCTSIKSLRTGGTWTYNSTLNSNQQRKPAFPVDMHDAADKTEYKAGDYLPEKSGRLFSYGKPLDIDTGNVFKYFPAKSIYLEQCGFIAFNSIRQMLEENMDEDASGAIPGIISTTVNNGTEEVSSKSYVPQGLCKFGDYYLATAYEKVKKGTEPKLSALYVLNSRWNVVTTVTVGDYAYHTGGIAYDSTGDVVWFCGNTDSTYKSWPFVYGLSGSTLRDAIESGQKHVHIKSFTTSRVRVSNKTSCLDYFNGRLWVGTFDTKKSILIGYKTTGTDLDREDTVTVSGLDTAINGFTFGTNSDLYLSRSTGRNKKQTSMIVRNRVSGTYKKGSVLKISGKASDKAEVNVPKMNEEIMINGTNMYVMYESGAKAYSNAHILTDRVTVIPLSLWGIGPKTSMLGSSRSGASLLSGITADEITEGEDGEFEFNYDSNSAGNVTETEYSFTPSVSGKYELTISGLQSTGDAFVTAEVLDGDDYTGYADTSEFDYDDGIENEGSLEGGDKPLVLNDSAECTLDLSAGHTYKIYATANYMKSTVLDETEDGVKYSGRCSIKLSRVNAAAPSAQVGGETTVTAEEGSTASYKVTPEKTGTYRLTFSSEGELGDIRILENMQNEVGFNGEFADLEAGKTYYVIAALNESDGSSAPCSISLAVEKVETPAAQPGSAVEITGDAAVTFTAPESAQYVITSEAATEGDNITSMQVYNSDSDVIAIGGSGMMFEAEENASYRILCMGGGSASVKITKYSEGGSGDNPGDEPGDDPGVNPGGDDPIDDPPVDERKDINSLVFVGIIRPTYTGKELYPPILIRDGDKYLTPGTDYTAVYSNNINAGRSTATATVTGIGSYKGTKTVAFSIDKAGNTMKGKSKTIKVKLSKLKKKNQVFRRAKAFTVTGQKGTLKYSISRYVTKKAKKKILVSSKSGNVTVKKGLKKGTYKVKVNITDSGSANYRSKTTAVTLKVVVK